MSSYSHFGASALISPSDTAYRWLNASPSAHELDEHFTPNLFELRFAGERTRECECRVNPVGIDIKSPRLSWIVSPSDANARGISQSAYRVIVASNPRELGKNTGDLWDTRKVESSQSIQLAYAGKPLTSGIRAFWKVQIWDQNGKRSPWSEPAFWSEGLLNADDWTAKWIGHDEKELWKNPQSPFRYLHDAHWIWSSGQGPQTFQIKISIPEGNTPKGALAAMSADREFELSLNGEPVGRSGTVGAPAVWDVTHFFKAGENDVLVRVERPAPSSPRLIGTFHIELQQGNALDVHTDQSWTADNSGVKDLGIFGCPPWGDIGYIEERALPARMLRKEFQAEGAVARATVYVSGLGLSELYLNGVKVGDQVLSPNLTDYDKRVHYVTYDLTGQVRPGKNAIGLILGNGRFWAPRFDVAAPTRNFGYPKARVQLEIEYASGKTQRVVSDETWKLTTDGPIRANNEYDGEEYDATAEITGWAEPEFDDSKWQAAGCLHLRHGTEHGGLVQAARVGSKRDGRGAASCGDTAARWRTVYGEFPFSARDRQVHAERQWRGGLGAAIHVSRVSLCRGEGLSRRPELKLD